MFVLSRVQLFGIPLTVAHQAPLSMGFPKQEYWSGNEYISYSQESYQPRDWTDTSYIGRQILYHCTSLEAQDKIVLL